MTIYFYAKTDNRLGLDRLRRTAALAKELQKTHEVYLMTTEFRSATYAKRELGIKKAVGIEDFRNIGTVCEQGDIIVYDSDEHNETIHQEMIDYFGRFFRISYDPKDMPKEGEILISPYIVGANVINGVLVDMDFFQHCTKEISRLFFYGDDDYNKRLLNIAPKLSSFDFELLEGFYFFVDMEEKLRPYFAKIHDSGEYADAIKAARLCVSASGQSALEAVAAGAKVIYMQREDKDEEYVPLLERAGVLNMGYFEPQKLEEAIVSAKVPNRDYLIANSVEKVAKKIQESI